MQRVRIRYSKQGRVRYVSARDLTSVWERALRRAELPIAFSQGFHPHAKVSFPDALPVGFASTGEYAELTFSERIDLQVDLARLSSSLPMGMEIMTYHEVPEGSPKLAKLLAATLWEIVLDGETPLDDLHQRCDTFLASESTIVVRHRPNGDRTLDVRPPVQKLAIALHDHTPVLRAVLLNDGPTIRPTDLATAFSLGDDLPAPRRHQRVVQGSAVEDGVAEALTNEIEPIVPLKAA